MIYQPEEDSYLLNEEIKKYTKGKSFLDIGSGSGIQAETALHSNAKSVLATDINPESIALLRKKGIKCIKSDLFSKISLKKFDIIAFNPPYLPKDKEEDRESEIITSGGKKGDEIILRFIEQAPNYISKKGKILLVLSSLTPKRRIGALIKKLGLKSKIISRKKIFMETLEVWEINHNNQ